MSRTEADYTAVRVDDEYNADEWWTALRAQYPRFAESLERNGCAVIHVNCWNFLAALPGFRSGREGHPFPLVYCGSEGPQWADVVGGPHQVFTVLS